MINKKLLRDISALKLDDNFEKLDGPNLTNYEHYLALFIENFPLIERKMKNALGAQDRKALAAELNTLCTMLQNIKADDLAAEGSEFLKLLENNDSDNDKIEAFASTFLVSAAMLSIDIHVVKYLEEGTHKEYVQKKNKSNKNNMKATALKSDKKTILAVDDTAMALTLLKNCLRGTPCNLICVNSGEDALHYLKENDPDLFILDIEMPQMDGYKLATKIRETGHEAPIIFLTNYSSKEHVMKALQAGASDFIVKPIYKANIDEKIHKYLS